MQLPALIKALLSKRPRPRPKHVPPPPRTGDQR